MVLTISQFVEAFFIALMLIFLTNPHLLSSVAAGHAVFNLFHLF